MSLQIAAQHLASKGRGPDTTLVHMAPGEVASLQSLARAHGGTLTTNPDTGLPEAGFLSAILPIVAGAALGPAGLGLSAMQAGLAAGALGTLATGSLKKGLMAGLGAYGGAGLMGSVAGTGTGALSQAAGTEGVNAYAANSANALQPIVPPAPELATAINPASPDFGGAMFTGPAPAPVAVTPTPNVGLSPEAINIGDVYGREQAAQNAVANRLATATPMDKISAGFESISKDPSKFFNKSNLGYGLAAAAPLMLGGEKQAGYTGSGGPAYEYSYDAGTGQYRRVAPGTRDRAGIMPYTPMQLAEGGPVENMSMRNDAQMMMTNGPEMYAGGGLSHLGDYSDGGRLLRGPGDGVSDDIPATIANKRPARLADGEFVVPARVVSELGNGSTEAGARKLYAMMDRVQKARGKTVGKGRIAVNSRAERHLPA